MKTEQTHKKPRSKETRIKISQGLKRHYMSPRGLKHRKISSAVHKGKQRPDITGPKSSRWKGDAVKYLSLHAWLHRWKPRPKKCEFCLRNPPRELANISGNYLRELSDYLWLCHRCHMRLDNGIRILLHPEKERARRLRNSQAMKKYWRELDPQLKTTICHKQAESLKEHYRNMSLEARIQQLQAAREERWSSRKKLLQRMAAAREKRWPKPQVAHSVFT